MRAPLFWFGIVVALSGASVAQVVLYDSPLPADPSASGISAESSSQDTSREQENAESKALPAAPSSTRRQTQRQRFMESLIELAPVERQRLTAEDKFNLFVEASHSPITFAGAGVSAGFMQATDPNAGFNRGWSGYSKRYGAALADSQTNAFFTKFLIPVLAHQDPRYKPSGDESFISRLFDAASQVVDTVDEDGDPTFNYSQVLGTVVSASISNAYYPAESRGMLRTANRAVNGLGGAAGANILREFWPDIKHVFVRRKVSQREIEALNWRTGSQPSILPEAK